jgi:hypothetical protein
MKTPVYHRLLCKDLKKQGKWAEVLCGLCDNRKNCGEYNKEVGNVYSEDSNKNLS